MGQFKRYANIYFLVTAIVQSISIISPLNPITAIAPFLFIMLISLIKEGFEDYSRHKSDIQVNASRTRRINISNGTKEEIQWANV